MVIKLSVVQEQQVMAIVKPLFCEQHLVDMAVKS